MSKYVDSLLMVEDVSDQAAVLNKCHAQYVSKYILLLTLMNSWIMYSLNTSELDFKLSLQLNAMKSSPTRGFVNGKWICNISENVFASIVRGWGEDDTNPVSPC